ncbi:uncharacterized protein LOC122527411 isoform X2 [Frieseomelitta varia]|uniref:uncharacterized protein LOC122527411 isoform X2 n=1 Tax=Frieseomelitta varia TaxID=561572 RepID=UPI001CB67C29|nr:uncharacterized protein LOC122527411 isoform X2 [Frieseomelitta varia]
MKLLYPSNIYQESWLLLSITILLGLYPIKFFTSTLPNYIHVFVLIMLYWFGYGVIIRHYVAALFYKFRDINHTFLIRYLRIQINFFLCPMIIISSMRQCLKLKEVFKQLDIVDKNVKFLNIEIDHTLCMKNDIVRITTTIFIVLMCNLIDYYGLLDNDSDFQYLLMWILDRLPDFVCAIVICSFTVFMNKIEIRFRQINTILNVITKGKHFISISEMSDMNNVSRYKLLKWLRFELRRTVSLLIEAHTFRFNLLTVIYVAYICLHMCIFYNHTLDSFYLIDIALSFIWGIVDLIKLVYIIYSYRSLTIEHS